MAFPYTTIANFEAGTLGHFDTEADTDGRLDFPHYTELARFPGLAMPWSGAYCMRVDLAGASNPAYVQETGSWDMTAGTNEIFLRFKLYLSKDLVMANTNEFAVLQFWSSTSTVEAGVYINYTTANGYRIGLGDASASSFQGITLGEWHDIEVEYDPAGGAAGTLDGWLNNTAFTQVGSLTDANITSGVLGVMGQDAGTTAGTVLFDHVVGHVDGARIGSGGRRFPEQHYREASGHVFVGHGIVDNAALLAGAGTDCVLNLYDTDTADTTNTSPRLVLKNLTNNESPVDPAGMPLTLTKGCYVELTGTNPRAIINLHRAVGYGSDGAVRAYAHRH